MVLEGLLEQEITILISEWEWLKPSTARAVFFGETYQAEFLKYKENHSPLCIQCYYKINERLLYSKKEKNIRVWYH